jgi:hypothetical protein
MGCVVAPTSGCVFAEPLKAAELGVTAAPIVAARREIKVATKRQTVTSFLPRTLQHCVRKRVLLKGCTILGRSLISYIQTTKFELRLVDRLFNFFAILLNLCYSPMVQISTRLSPAQFVGLPISTAAKIDD